MLRAGRPPGHPARSTADLPAPSVLDGPSTLLSHPVSTVDGVHDGAQLLEGLDEAQRHAVTVEAAPLCVLAGAGSGKTRVLSRRIAWRVATGSASGPHVLALTFTRKAAGELRERLVSLGVREQVAAGTFHALAYAQLRRWWADRRRAAPTLLDRKATLLHRLLASSPQYTWGGSGRVDPTKKGPPGAEASTVGALAAEIEWAKARLVGPADYADAAVGAGRRPPLAPSVVGELYARYEAEKHRRGLVDLDDLLVVLGRALQTDEELAAAQRWRWRHLFVDEFQDVNPAQWRLLSAWLGDHADLCVVGDPNQAIYGWNGADPALLATFHRRWPRATVVQLDANYRSSPQVLSVARAVLAHDDGRPPGGAAGSDRGPGARPLPGPALLSPKRPDGPIPDVISYENDRAEAAGIARRLRQAHPPGSPWSRLAVLARTNAQLVLMEEALVSAGIPCRVAAGASFLRRPEVQEVLAQLQRPPRWHTLDTAIRDLELATATRGDDLDEDATERVLALGTLARLAREYQALEPGASVTSFGRWLSATLPGEQLEAASADAVELTTFHRAKGLEWPVVFVAGLEEGLVPIVRAVTEEAEAEERRLLYVALTRAQAELHVSWARRRTLGQRTLARSPSPYLEGIQAAIRAMAGHRLADPGGLIEKERRRLVAMTTPVEGHRRTPGGAGSTCRDRSGRLRPADRLARSAEPRLLEALRVWRAGSARAAGVPAHVVLHDATLAAVAASVPTNLEELIRLPGLGPVKASRYGADLLELTARHRQSA